MTKLDLVSLQLSIALGRTLRDLGLEAPPPVPTLTSIQTRINAEVFQPDGSTLPTAGTLTAFAPPHGPAYRLDTAAHPPLRNAQGGSYRIHPSFDSLLAKLIVTAPTYVAAVQLSDRGLASFEIGGCQTNRHLLRALLRTEAMSAQTMGRAMHTGYVQAHAAELHAAAKALEDEEAKHSGGTADAAAPGPAKAADAPAGTEGLSVPMAGVIVSIDVKPGDSLSAGQQVAVLEAMKMEHIIRAEKPGTVEQVAAKQGEVINPGVPLLFFKSGDSDAAQGDASKDTITRIAEEADLEEIRPELQSLLDRKQQSSDAGRPAAVKRRHGAGYLTAQENLDQLVDEGSFIELGDLAMAAQRSRIDMDKLKRDTSGDAVRTGWATINAKRQDLYPSPWRAAICMYDYMVLAGTQGYFHHLKLDRLFSAVLNNPAPLVLYAEGGGGRPGDTDVHAGGIKVGGLDTPSFALLASIQAAGILSIGVANGYVFAGNAALLGTCDIIIATVGGDKSKADKGKAGVTSIGMGGPAMIEGGGLGVYKVSSLRIVAGHRGSSYRVVISCGKAAFSRVSEAPATTCASCGSRGTFSKCRRPLRAVPP